MDAARLNYSHGLHDEHAEMARLVRRIQEESGRPLALIADLQGPKLRIGDLRQPVTLTRGEEVVVAPAGAASDGELPVSPAAIGEVLQPGHNVLIDDGMIRLRVERVESGRAVCTVLAGGLITSHKGVNLPGVPLPIPSLTPKDREDLTHALELGVDYIALSFVRSADDVRELKELIKEHGSRALVIAKIEKAEAVSALDGIVEEADAVMVARGDLGVETGPASVPLVQKRIILRSLDRGKPVITATQMLESMIQHLEPTRAEASDVANAILDWTSAVMLSGETAVGEYPIEAVAYMDRIARAVEPAEEPTVGEAVSNAACDLAEAIAAQAILVPTFSGRTASVVARLRPHRVIIGLTHNRYAAQQMALEWGVEPTMIPECTDVEDLWNQALVASRRSGLVAAGDRVVITGGTSVNMPGSTNVIKVDVA